MSQSLREINTTPLIDVLLVLLVLLVITLPRTTHRVTLDLPAGHAVNPPGLITNVEVDFDGRVFWNGAPVPDDRRLEQWFSAIAGTSNTVRIFPDPRASYERVAQVLASAQRAHVSRLALAPVSD